MLINVKDTVVGLIAVVVIGILIAVGYNYEVARSHKVLAKRIAGLSPKGGTPRTIEDLKKAIAIYEDQIELNVKTGAQTGVYWKILGIRLADKGMHKDAVEAFDKALYYNSDDPTLFYLTGESASVAAASTLEFNDNSLSDKARYQRIAESAYLRAIEMDPTYAKPRMGLGLLYTFDMNRPADAIPQLDRYLQINSGDIRGMFVLARAYFMTGDNNRAIELYDRIIYRSKDPKVRAEAQNNKDFVRDAM